jgi:predicted phosphoribosyltransferase
MQAGYFRAPRLDLNQSPRPDRSACSAASFTTPKEFSQNWTDMIWLNRFEAILPVKACRTGAALRGLDPDQCARRAVEDHFRHDAPFSRTGGDEPRYSTGDGLVRAIFALNAMMREPAMLFRDREDAGERLAQALAAFRGRNCVVLALPRGGVPVAAKVAAELAAPLDLLLVRKIGAPRQPELAIGAVIDGGTPIIVRDQELIRLTGTSARQFDELCAQEIAEIERRRKFYLGGRPAPPLDGRIAIVVDDGLATGNTMRAALQAARMRNPKLLVMAIPVAPPGTLDVFHGEADQIICLAMPEPFGSVGQFYQNFTQVTDAEVMRLLAESPRQAA